MKRLLFAIGAITMTLPGAISLTALAKHTQQTTYILDSFKSVVKIINTKFNNVAYIDGGAIDETVEAHTSEYYHKTLNGRTGDVLKWEEKPSGEENIVATYTGKISNNTDREQKALTPSRTETAEVTHSFTMNVSEKVSNGIGNEVVGELSVPFARLTEALKFEFGVEKGKEQTWETVKRNLVEETIPSQEIVQGPHTVLHFSYQLKRTTSDFRGIARFKVDDLTEKSFRIPIFTFNSNKSVDYVVWTNYSFADIVKDLRELGYGEQISGQNQREFSVVSTQGESEGFINLPISWTSNDLKFEFTYFEEPITI